MSTLSIALRNLIRNSRRSIATLLGISIGLVAVLLFGGYKANINYSMQTAYVRTGGHLQIQHKDYFLYGSGNPTAYGIADYRRLIDALQKDPVLQPMLVVVTPTLQFGGIAGNYAASVSHTIVGNGVDAAESAKLRVWDAYQLNLDTPDFLLKNSPPNAAILGLGLARVLQLCSTLQIPDCPQPGKEPAASGSSMPDELAALSAQETPSASAKAGAAAAPGDAARRIELLASSTRGMPNVAALNVLKAESQGFKEYDEVYVMLHLDQAQRLVYGGGKARVTSILVQLRDSAMTAAAQERIAANLTAWSGGQPLVVRDFRFLNPFYVQSINMFSTIFGFVFLLIGSIVMFTVGNTMNTAVVERTVEIGTLRAIGMRRAGILRMFLTEGFLLGGAGALLGLVLTLVIAFIVNRLDFHWLPPGSSSPVPLALSVWGETGMILWATAGLVVIATLSAWRPAYRAGRLSVVDALRHV